MNILFVCYGDFRTNSVIHIAAFCQGLAARGHECVVAVARDPDSLSAIPAPAFKGMLHSRVVEAPACFSNGKPADIIHAWTPRHEVAACVFNYQRNSPSPAKLLVHLEDNEEHLAASGCGMPFERVRQSTAAIGQLRSLGLIHPWRYLLFLHAADAITHITPALAEMIPDEIPRLLLLPALDPSFVQIRAREDRLVAELGIPPDCRLIVYPGSVNATNADEVRSLYNAVALLNRRGVPVRLVRTGLVPHWFEQTLDAEERSFATELGFVDRALIPRLLALADVLVQPGWQGPFNDYRMPSKLAEFLASGKPVVMPATNLAAILEEGVHALFLHQGTPEEIADRCMEIFAAPARAAEMGANARQAARQLFSLEQQTTLLEGLYARVAAQASRVSWNALRDDHWDEHALFPHRPTSGALPNAVNWAKKNPRFPRHFRLGDPRTWRGLFVHPKRD